MNDCFRLSTIRFTAGPRPDASVAELTPGHVTILVGPNGSGKSLALREIEGWARGSGNWGEARPNGKVVNLCAASLPNDETELREFLAPRAAPEQGNPGGGINILTLSVDQPGQSGGSTFVRTSFTSMDPHLDHLMCQQVMTHYTMRLDGRSRLGLVDPQMATSLQAPPGNVISTLYRRDDIRKRLQEMVASAFGRHLVIDATILPNLQFSLSDSEPTVAVERALTDEAVAFFRRAVPVKDLSDGIQAFIGLMAAVLVVPHTLILIDEPEAFLHPTLARQLGRNLAQVAIDRDARLVTATHSADFLLGCVEVASDTAIVRLGYEKGYGSARVLDGDSVRRMTADPLLRSADALRALFARSTVVCEADSDRVMYEEANRRLNEATPPRGMVDCIFLNAQNWQTTSKLAAPLRQLGVPAAVILDLDTVVNDDHWPELIAMARVASQERDNLLNARRAAGVKLAALGRTAGERSPLVCKKRGIKGLSDPADRAELEGLLRELAKIGIFVVPVGEMENWLANLGVTNKENFVVEMFTKLGMQGDAYPLPAGEGDIWAFVESVRHWVDDPERAGLG